MGEPVRVLGLHAVPYLLMLEQQEESPGGRPVVGKRRHQTRYVKSTSQATWGVGVTGPNRRYSKDWTLLGRKYGSMSLFLGKIRASFMVTYTCWCPGAHPEGTSESSGPVKLEKSKTGSGSVSSTEHNDRTDQEQMILRRN